MTTNCAAGCIEYNDSGEFQELRTAGVQLIRDNDETLILNTVAGPRLTLRSISPILVSVVETGGWLKRPQD